MSSSKNSDSLSETYQEKVIISGNIIEHYRYEKPIVLSRRSKNNVITSSRRGKVASPDVMARNRKKSANKARNSIRRLSHSNAGMYKDSNGNPMKPVFVTLTFRDILSPDQVTKEFKNFVMRLNYFFRYKKAALKYVGVAEYNKKRGEVNDGA